MDGSNPATVADFRADTYEVTVGRFRKFVAAYPGNKPVAGAGKNPNDPADPGWDEAWNGAMPSTQVALTSAVKCNSTYQTWTDTVGGNENRPINCVTWYEAFAFCVWDGGRLPTEAEWNFLAAGGSEQRVYPWSSPPTSTTRTCSYANYASCPGDTLNVGSKSPTGDGRWGHADVAGNVFEWVLDWSASAYPNPCANCSNLTSGTNRVLRGGSFDFVSNGLYASFRGSFAPTGRPHDAGVRCVRSPSP
jgi:formylglycine-generating enzyme required for sulfatase activity